MAVPLTIGIITAGRPGCLERCIGSVRTHVTTPHHMVVLDSLANPELEATWAAAEDVTYRAAPRPVGPSAARRLIAEALETPRLLYLDDDIEVRPGTVEALMTYLDTHDGVDIATGVWNEYDQYRMMGQFFVEGEQGETPIVTKKFLTVEAADAVGLSSARVDGGLATMLLRAEVLEAVQFDPRYDFYYELYDFFMQCKRAGMNVQAVRKAVFDHKPVAYLDETERQRSDTEVDKERFAEKWGLQPIGSVGGVQRTLWERVLHKVRRFWS